MRKPSYEELEKKIEALQSKSERFNMRELWNVCSQTQIPSCTVSVEGKILEQNTAMAELTGYTNEEIKKEPDIDEWIRKLIPDKKYSRIARDVSNKIREKVLNLINVELPIIRKNGEHRDVEFSIFKIFFDGKPSEYMIVQALDITERKNAVRELNRRVALEHILSDISRSFINIQQDEINEGINRELHTIGSFSGADRSYLIMVSDDERTMNVTHEWCAEEIHSVIGELSSLSVDTYPWMMKKLKNLNTIIVTDSNDLPVEAEAEKELLESQHIQSLVVVPIVYGKRLVGYTEFDYVKKMKRLPGEEILIMLKTVGDIFINALERKRTMEALQMSKEKYHTLTENIYDIIYSMDNHGIITYVGSQISRYGYRPEDVISRPFVEFLAPEDRGKTVEDFQRTMETSNEFPTQFRVVDKYGMIHWVEDNGVVQYDDKGTITGLTGILRDITEHKKSEKALQTSRAKLQEQKTALEHKTGALKEIIGQIEIEKNTIKNDVISNVNEIILPILKKIRLKESSTEYIDILQHLLENLSSTFGRKLTHKSIKLTPREIEISTMIKSGLTNKEISKLTGISCQTVEKHRKNIRKKLDITNKNINLTSYLQQM